jgi:ketosteroid isomerase-like protein
MDASEAIAREQIRDVISRYNHAGDHGDLEALVRCFTEAGVLEIKGEEPSRGRAAILERLSREVASSIAVGARALVRHHVSSIRIERTGSDSAIAASYFVVFTEIGLDHWGTYSDQLERDDGTWRIAHRKVRVDGASPDSRMATEHRVGGGRSS